MIEIKNASRTSTVPELRTNVFSSIFMEMEYASNPKARFDYEILETIEAGLVLKGYEVRSIKTGKVSIKGAYVRILNEQAYLLGAVIPPYQPANTPPDYDPQANRKLLLTAKQLSSLVGLSKSHSVSMVPLKLYGKKGKIKLLIGIAKGKKKYDKREAIKKREFERQRRKEVG
jgi:SsrA-binding protein